MKTLTAKQEARLEKKKKKIAALAEIIKLNDKDRNIRTNCNELDSFDSGTSTGSNDEQKDIKRNNKESYCYEGNSEPNNKKMKLDSIGDYRHKDDPALVTVNKNVKKLTENLNIPEALNELEKQKFSLSEDQYVQIKKELRERKRIIRNVPKIRLKHIGELASLNIGNDSRTPIFLTDIQHLLMTALIGSGSPCLPSRWCYLEKSNRVSHSVVIVLEGISMYHFLTYESHFKEMNKIFDHKLEVVMPLNKEGNIIEELASIPLTNSQKEEIIQTYGSLEAGIEISKDPTLMVKTMFPVQSSEEYCVGHINCQRNFDIFPRTKLLLSALQMVDEGYPLPLRGELALKYQDYVFTKDKYCKVTADSPMFGLDCEMCRTCLGYNELTRISIVDENLTPLYETLVRPTNKIVDYLTEYSGITAEMMFNVTKTLEEVQNDVRNILPCDAILVGQSLNADLHAMKMMHPYVIDTSVIFNLTGERRKKAKLKTLVKMFLGEEIQEGLDGHCPTEDSQASMKLTKLKLSKGVDFGDVILYGRKRANEHFKKKQDIKNNLFGHASKHEKKTSLITGKDLRIDLLKYFNNKVKVISDDNPKDKTDDVGVHWYKAESDKSILRKAQEISRNYALTIANSIIPPQKLETSRIEKTISNIDKWVHKQWGSILHNGLFVVLFGGSPGSSSGVALVKIKKSFSDVVSESSNFTI